MTNEITDIILRLDRALSLFEKDAFITLSRTAGTLEQKMKLPGSSHAQLAVHTHLPRLQNWMNAIPVISGTGGNWSISASRHINRKTRKFIVEYRCRLMGLDITRPASLRYRTASEMISGAHDRLKFVEDNCQAVGQPAREWYIDSKERFATRLLARSPREAAWTFAALYVRNRADIRTWKDTVKSIQLLTEVFDPKEWQAPRA